MTSTTPWALVESHPCITIRCADCSTWFGADDTEDTTRAHLPDINDARESLDDAGWTIQGPEAICETCTNRRLCTSVGGHDWKTYTSNNVNWWTCRTCHFDAYTNPTTPETDPTR